MTQDAMSTPSETPDTPSSATEDNNAPQMLDEAMAGWPDENADTSDGKEQQPKSADKPGNKGGGEKDDDKLGDAGKSALRTERQARRDAEKQLRELRSRLAEYEDRDKTELQKAQEAAKQYEQELNATRVANARLMAAAIHNLPPDLIDLLGDGTDEEIDARAKLLAEKLAASAPPPQAERDPSPAQTRPVESLIPGARPASQEPEDPNAWLRRMAGRAP